MEIRELKGDGIVLMEKRLSTRERVEEEAVLRLRSEASLLRALGGRIAPRLVASGEDARGPWHQTEKVAFPTLAEHLRRANGAPLAREFVERAARAAYSVLAKLHEASDELGPLGIVHADLSPANIALSNDGREALLLDFDLASWRDGPTHVGGSFRGTIAYAPPELARCEAPTVSSDLFGLAASLLHAMTGSPPRVGPSFAALLATAGETPLAALEDEALPRRGRAHAAILSCLAHDPEERPVTARAVLEAMC